MKCPFCNKSEHDPRFCDRVKRVVLREDGTIKEIEFKEEKALQESKTYERDLMEHCRRQSMENLKAILITLFVIIPTMAWNCVVALPGATYQALKGEE